MIRGLAVTFSAIAGACLVLAAAPLAAAQQAAPAPAEASGGGESDAALAQELANPVASLISVPFQNNAECCFGPDNGFRNTMNIQPVIPYQMGPDLTLIVRTIVPVIYQTHPAAFGGDQIGLGDTTQSFFFAPKLKGFIFGVGPVFLWPTGTGGFGSGRWGAGPTFVALRQQGGLTYGLLFNHLWSFAGRDDHARVSSTFLQPFVSYNFPDTTSLGLNTESSYDWVRTQWTVPINLTVGHLYKFGPQRVQFTLGGKYYAESAAGPQWGVRFTTTLLFPAH